MKTLADQETRKQFRLALGEIMRREINYEEKPGNMTKYGAWFGLNGHPWCAMYVSWVYDQAAKRVVCENPLKGVQTPKGFAGVTASFAVMKRRGWLVAPSEPLMGGDIICWDHDTTPGGPGHTGMVNTVPNNSKFSTVEGNTNTAFSRTGGMVCRHEHSRGDGRHGVLLGIVRPTRKYGP